MKRILIGLTLISLSLTPVFSAYVTAPTTITDSTQCYLIDSTGSGNSYQCQIPDIEGGILATPCYYDIIVKDASNVQVVCDLNRALIYNSTNITFVGQGTIVIWDSNLVNCVASDVTGNTVEPGTGFLICTPPDIYINATLLTLAGTEGVVPVGALGILSMTIEAKNNIENVYITIKPSCAVDLVPFYTSKPASIAENSIFFDRLSSGEIVNVEFYYRPLAGQMCTFAIQATVGGKSPTNFRTNYITITGKSGVTIKIPISDPGTIIDKILDFFIS